jgi:hypothetical protein
MLTGKILVLDGTPRSDLLRGRMPRPLVVVHSGNKTIERLGYLSTRVERSTRREPGAGCVDGALNARKTA